MEGDQDPRPQVGPLSHSGSPAPPDAPTHSRQSPGRPLGSADRSLSGGSGGRVASPACWAAGSPPGSWHGYSWASGSPARHTEHQAGNIKQGHQNRVKDALALVQSLVEFVRSEDNGQQGTTLQD